MEILRNNIIDRIYRMIFNCKNELQINTIKNYITQAQKMNYISEKEKDILINLLNSEVNKTGFMVILKKIDDL